MNIENYDLIDKLVDELKIPYGSRGTSYIAYILDNFSNSELYEIVKVYMIIAEKFSTEWKSVENSIRYVKNKTEYKNFPNKEFLIKLKRIYR